MNSLRARVQMRVRAQYQNESVSVEWGGKPNLYHKFDIRNTKRFAAENKIFYVEID
ncbi:hypothetical protein Fmac_001356 [Flemingia macrophylla]|uniref:Uncharacterized protein n=1 Tax=Flemingia macrophylla TaxID=520843 RepID=A0ABD1NHD0_9FABA